MTGSQPIMLDIAGVELAMYVHDSGDPFVSATLRRHGVWEPFETEVLSRAVFRGARVLDVGANIGYFSVLAGEWVGDEGRVYAFEPESRNAEVLERNIALNGLQHRVECVVAALSDHAGEGRLYLNSENLGDHQLYSKDPDRESVAVPLLVGADWFEGRESALDFVKIDVQGAEHAVVKGLMPLLRASGDNLHILLELTPKSLREAGTTGRQLIETLATLGLPFSIVDHIEHRLAPTTAEDLATWCDNIDAYPEDAGFMNILVGSPV